MSGWRWSENNNRVESEEWRVKLAPDRESLAQHKRRFVLPLEGKGDRSAVDEYQTYSPSRSVFSLSIALDSDLTANLSPALTRGAGGGTLSVGSRCPRLESVRRGKPL